MTLWWSTGPATLATGTTKHGAGMQTSVQRVALPGKGGEVWWGILRNNFSDHAPHTSFKRPLSSLVALVCQLYLSKPPFEVAVPFSHFVLPFSLCRGSFCVLLVTTSKLQVRSVSPCSLRLVRSDGRSILCIKIYMGSFTIINRTLTVRATHLVAHWICV